MQTIACDATIKIPAEVAVCPICGAEVIFEDIDEWEQEEDGSWSAGESGTYITCVTDPDIEDEDASDDFMSSHWSMPYVDWLPVRVKVWQWLRQNYRFDLEHPC